MNIQLHYPRMVIFLTFFLFFATSASLSAQCDQVNTFAGMAGIAGNMNGTGTAASFSDPRSVAVDAAGNVYVADQDNHSIRRISTTGAVTTLAGTGAAGTANGTGTAASFDDPAGVAVDAAGNVYVADRDNSAIRVITPAGVVTTLAGVIGDNRSTAGATTNGTIDGIGAEARFDRPLSVAVDQQNNILYVTDQGRGRDDLIRRIDLNTGEVSTLPTLAVPTPVNRPTGIAVDQRNGIIYVVDRDNGQVLQLDQAGVITNTFPFPPNGNPAGVTVDAAGNVYVTERLNHQISVLNPTTGATTILAGMTGNTGSIDGRGTAASFNTPSDIAIDSNGTIYIADRNNNLIRTINCPVLPPNQPIPTMSEWGLMIFGLLVLNLSVFYIREQELILG